jgi:uncharacterized membrane protein
MTQLKNFLSKKDEEEIIEAIKQAERKTSGEIRVHIEAHTDEDHFDHALKVFEQLEMHQTAERNGVLIYIAVNDHQFVILGDEGINQVVPADFWNKTRDVIQSQFRQGNFKQGIIDGIHQAGKELKLHFPYQENDTDELSNEISKSS